MTTLKDVEFTISEEGIPLRRLVYDNYIDPPEIANAPELFLKERWDQSRSEAEVLRQAIYDVLQFLRGRKMEESEAALVAQLRTALLQTPDSGQLSERIRLWRELEAATSIRFISPGPEMDAQAQERQKESLRKLAEFDWPGFLVHRNRGVGARGIEPR